MADDRAEEIRVHAEALLHALWDEDHDRAEEIAYHREVLDRLRAQQTEKGNRL